MICDGCNVRPPWEHRCSGAGCECPDCREVERYAALPKVCPMCCFEAIKAGMAREGYVCQGCSFSLGWGGPSEHGDIGTP